MSPTTTTTSAPGMPQFVNRQRNHMPCIAGHHIKSNPHKVESFPRGYPSLAAFLSSDKEFTVFRCFSRLHTRVLLHKQDELAQLEQRLDELDEEDSRNNSYRLLTNRHRGGDQDRQVLLGEIERKLNEYNTLFQSLRDHLEGPELEESQIENIRNWMDGRKPIIYAETSFLDDWGDLRRPNYSTDRGGLEDLIDRCSSLPHMQGIYKFLSLFDPSPRSDDPEMKLLKASRLITVSRALATILAVATLVIPIGVLYIVQAVPIRLCIIAAFTAIFSSALCCLTSSRTYELFSATAAYCAVMVVFVGSLPGS